MRSRNIYILLTDTGTWFSRMIKLYTKAPYNHASISIDENLEELYSFGRKVYYNPLSAGFIKERMDQGVFFYKKNTKCLIYKIEVSEKQYNQFTKNIAQFKCFKDQYRYNLLGVMAIAVNKRLIRENAFTCSQFVASMLVTPEDITKIPQLTLIYEGKLRDYYQDKNEIFNQNLYNYNQYNTNI